MEITKGFKYQNREYGSKTFEVTVSHHELGLPEPSDSESVRDNYAKMAAFLEGLLLVEQVKEGLLPPSSISENIQAWLPPNTQNSTSSTTERD